MENFYYFDYLPKDIPSSYLEVIKYELDTRVYHYGRQFKNPQEKYGRLKPLFFDVMRLLYGILTTRKKVRSNYFISGGYFGLDKLLPATAVSMPWKNMDCCHFGQFIKLFSYRRYLANADFNELVSEKGYKKFREAEKILTKIYSNPMVLGVILPQDLSSMERLSIHVCKIIGKKSFVFLHGLPGRYNGVDDNRADYLVVWGKKIKDLYVASGVKPEKIFISGHPIYSKGSYLNHKIDSSLDNILVLSKAMNGSQHSESVKLSDRGNLITYLLMIQKVLLKMGVSKVRLRLHPSEDDSWYLTFLDRTFFEIDRELDLQKTIRASSLVVGPTSSVFLESLIFKKNYIVFEPSINKVDVMNYLLVSPFDKTDNRVVIATDELELYKCLSENQLSQASIIDDYIQPNFDLSFIDKMI